jgi:endonuclease/exonuclease/phosphatase family metal-dependent hydrolase
MRLATFNLESFGGTGEDPVGVEERIGALAPVLRRLDADILCLQEVNAEKVAGERRLGSLQALTGRAGYGAHHIAHTTGPAGGLLDIHNVVTLSRFPIRKSFQLKNDLVPPPAVRLVTAVPPAEAPMAVVWDRPALLTEIELPDGRSLHLVNAHLRAPLAAPIPGQKEAPFRWRSVSGWAEGYYLATMKRIGQALEIRLAVERVFEADVAALVAVAGDLNAEEFAPALRLLVAAGDDTGNGALAPRVLIPVDRSVAADRRYSVLHHGRPQMLDHILVSRTLLGLLGDVEVHNETLADELLGAGKQLPGSFHAPLVARFTLD